ncbi:hypothetical protein ACOSQ4_003074 [Xanthoceras sorbifolium]
MNGICNLINITRWRSALACTISDNTCGGFEAVGDKVLAIDVLGCLPGIEHKLLEAIVGTAPGVMQGLAEGHPTGKAVEVAATEGLDGGRLTADEGRMKRDFKQIRQKKKHNALELLTKINNAFFFFLCREWCQCVFILQHHVAIYIVKRKT